MLPSLTVAFIVGLFIGSQIPYFPLVRLFPAPPRRVRCGRPRTIQSCIRSKGYVALRSTLSRSRLLGGGRQSDCP